MVALPRLDSPPLENGDRLTRSQFEQRYAAAPHIHKAELIEGVVFVASPVRARSHGRPHGLVVTWLGVYAAATPSVDLAVDATVRLDEDNEVQPDALLRLEPEVGGNSVITPDDYIAGAPELVVEVAASSASYDLGDKLKVYRRNGVQEYLVWQQYENEVLWLRWQEGRCVPLDPDEAGILRSQVFPGLWLSVEALRQGDRAALLATLQSGLHSPDHAAFRQRLSCPDPPTD